MTSYTRAIAGALLLALSSGGMATSASAAPIPAVDPAPSESPAADPLAAQIADTTSQLQTDLGEMRAQQDAARDRYEEARAKAMKLQQLVDENQAAADEARLIGHHLHKHPVSHPGMADERFDGGDFHD